MGCCDSTEDKDMKATTAATIKHFEETQPNLSFTECQLWTNGVTGLDCWLIHPAFYLKCSLEAYLMIDFVKGGLRVKKISDIQYKIETGNGAKLFGQYSMKISCKELFDFINGWKDKKYNCGTNHCLHFASNFGAAMLEFSSLISGNQWLSDYINYMSLAGAICGTNVSFKEDNKKIDFENLKGLNEKVGFVCFVLEDTPITHLNKQLIEQIIVK